MLLVTRVELKLSQFDGVADLTAVDRGDRVDHRIPIADLLIELGLRGVRLVAGKRGIEVAD